MARARSVLIVGGGSAGNTLAILLANSGVSVDLVESRPDWGVLGSGILLHGNALRVLRDAGVWPQVRDAGFAFDSIGILAPDGTVVAEQPDLHSGGSDLPSTLGILRPALQQILIDAVRASGTRVRLGCTVEKLDDQGEGAEAVFSDGTASSYDLVVGCDGIYSTTRESIGVTDRPEPTGMGVWRTLVPRPAELVRTDLAYGGPCHIAGYSPMSDDLAYALLVVDWHERDEADPADYAERMCAESATYGGLWPTIRAHITDPAAVHYTAFHRLLVEGPWHRGRIALAGDAVHVCPPTLAQGVAMSLEDAAVVAELLSSRDVWDDALLTEYRDRRMPRVQTVVDGSMQLAQWLREGNRQAAPALIARILTALIERP
ncbi:FAD-dependent monooxygenase [Streptomyces cinnabarinus]|uniref:FAD-dependent monooxygenase n=1 Tax=Streptomyces cinnabarinus TaxID=67287 RepID=A0ABY7K6V8_9ACTN|nr:FAD-dependent monooxygenase [Streptomyces cinnabarinus]WAZ20251.1 FAD-dependent monooxygenase [Streptomyces cinnabarinus]